MIIRSSPRKDGALTVVEVGDGYCVLSTGEQVAVKFEKLRHLVEQLTQDSCPVTVRLWQGRDGVELIHIYRADGSGRSPTTITLATEDVAF